MFQSFLTLRRYAFLRGALLLAAGTGLLYFLGQRPWFDTTAFWVDYALGVMAAGLVIFMAWYGIRKRQYASDTGNLSDWLSAHVYLGLAAVLVASLHAGTDWSMDVHTLTYALFIFVSLSGVLGLILVVTIPARLARTADGRTFDVIIQQIADINRECRTLAAAMDDDANRLIRRSVQYTEITGSLIRRLTAQYPDLPMKEAATEMRKRAHGSADAADRVQQIVVLLARKADLLAIARRHVQLQTLLSAWRFLHVPATFGLLAALAVHVFVIHYFW